MPRGRAPTKKTRSFGDLKASVKSSGIASVSPRQAQEASMQKLQDRREQTRKDFFKGNQDISDNRLDRRQIQDDLIEQFKQEQMKLVPGTTNLLQKVDPTGMDLTEYRNMVTNKYGPTLGEVGGDIVRGLGSIAGGVGNFIGGGGILGALMNAIGGAKNLGSKGLGFLQNLFGSPADAAVYSQAIGPKDIRGNIDYSSFIVPTNVVKGGDSQGIIYYPELANANQGINQIRTEEFVERPSYYVDEDFTGDNTLNYMDYDGRPFIKTNL